MPGRRAQWLANVWEHAKMALAAAIQDIEQLQLEAYRRMTGEERLRIGLGLYEACLAIAREAIRNRFPDVDEATVEEKLRQGIRMGYEIESTKSPSPPASLPASGARGARQMS